MKSFRSISVLCAALALGACEKNGVQDIAGSLPASQIKFFNFGVNAPGVNFYANDVKMSAISSATGVESTTGTVYGGVSAGGYYSGIAPGTYALTGKIASATDKDLVIANVSAPIADGKYYSYYMSGFYNTTTKTVDAFVVEDAVPPIDATVTYVRFVNAISNSSPMTLYAKNTTTAVETPIGSTVAYKSGGAFTSLPEGVYDLSARVAGSSTNAISRAAVSFNAGRVYTITARGDITVVSTTAATRPFLDNTANR